MIFIRLTRMIPLLLAMAVLAAVVYAIASLRYSPPKAKEILAKMFTVITGVLSVFFGLFTLYALFEHNGPVFDLAVSFLIFALVMLGITRICYAVFLRNNPHYRAERTDKGRDRAHVIRTLPWRRRR